MRWLDITFATPAENLACDDVLLNMVEEETHEEFLRFWESPQHFVVLGSSNKVYEEVHVDVCRADSIPIVRRHSGGGAVLQGPGCLNFSLVLVIHPDGPTRNITETTRFIMQRHANALAAVLGRPVDVRGSSDLTIGNRKFSGNAQRRRLKALLFHGTFLLQFDLALMEKYLKRPARQPAYRQQRAHSDFVCNIGVDAQRIKHALIAAWRAVMHRDGLPIAQIEDLARAKHSSPEWVFSR
jgi:lipoate-protein ligase A